MEDIARAINELVIEVRRIADVMERNESKNKPQHGYMWVCSNCGLDVHSDYGKCPRCGEPKDEPQMETEIARAIIHKMIDDAVIAEDVYPDLRQKMHDAVDEYKPQTERSTQ